MVDVIVLNYNDAKETVKYVKKISVYESIENIIVVDNKSTDDSYEELKSLRNEKINVIQTEKNGGYGYGNNFGIRYACEKFKSKYVAITNPDVVYDADTIKKCEEFLIKNAGQHYAVVAPRMKNIEGEYVLSAWNIPSWFEYVSFSMSVLGKFFKLNYVKSSGNEFDECECIAGSMIVMDADAFERAGMYDEDIFLYCEETVLGIKMKRVGYRTAILNTAEFIHAHSVSINKSISSIEKQQQIMWNSRLYALKKYYGVNNVQFAISELIGKIGIWETKLRTHYRGK